MNISAVSNDPYGRYNCSALKSSSTSESSHLNDPALKIIVDKIVHIANTNTLLAEKDTLVTPKDLSWMAAEQYLQPKAKHNISDSDLWDMAAKVKDAPVLPNLKNVLPHISAKIIRESIISTNFEKAIKRVQQGEDYNAVANESGIRKNNYDITNEMMQCIITPRHFGTEQFTQCSLGNNKSPTPTLKDINVDTTDSGNYRKLFDVYKRRAINSLSDGGHTKMSPASSSFMSSVSNSFNEELLNIKLEREFNSGF